MLGLLPLLVAMAIAETATRVPWAPVAWPRLLAAMGAGLVAWAALCVLFGGIAARSRRRRALADFDVAGHTLMLVWFAWLCFGAGWAKAAEPFYSVALAPWLLALLAHWWGQAIALGVARGNSPGTRSGFVLHQVRYALLPVLVVLPLVDAGSALAMRLHIPEWLWPRLGLLTNALGTLLLSVLLIVVLPVVLVRLWRAQPLPPGPLADALGATCAQLGVRVRALLRWPLPGGRAYNAAVMGVLPRWRYVLFSDDLLRDFSLAEVTAVLGHELGHVRHRHLWLYVLFVAVAGLASFLAEPFTTAALTQVPGLNRIEPHLLHGAVVIVQTLIAMRVLFGYLSRACERQADLAGAEACGDAAMMQQALARVAWLSGQSEDEPSWRHHSIARRVAYLEQVRARPALAAQHHRRVRLAGMLLLLTAAALALLAIRDAHHRVDPAVTEPPAVLSNANSRNPS